MKVSFLLLGAQMPRVYLSFALNNALLVLALMRRAYRVDETVYDFMLVYISTI